MGVTLQQGFRPYLLKHISEVFGPNSTPQYKIEPVGFLNMLLSQKRAEFLRLNTAGGHKNSVQIKYKQRFNKAHTQTTKSCDPTQEQAYREASVDLSATRQFAIHIGDEMIAKYMDEASVTVAVGKPSTGIMNELLEDIISGASAICEGINEDLFSMAPALLGVNRATGSSAAKTINFPLNTTNNPLNQGLTEMLSDYKINTFSGRPQIVGSGLLYNFLLQQASKGNDQSGLDTKIQAAGVDFFFDLAAINTLGANQVIMYEPNTIQLVEYMEYTGYKAGYPGVGPSIFGTMSLPIMTGSVNQPVDFDWQLKYNDCAVTTTDAYYGTPLTLQKGWNFIISKQCGLFAVPADAYRGTDKLVGNRSSLRYQFTNV